MVAPDLPREAEVVVVGGGCMGASIAFHLARRDVDVALLEKGHVAGGATGHSGALVRQHYEARIGIRLARESLAFFLRFEKETGFSCDFRTTGFLSGTRERDLPAFDALLELLRSEGVRAERLTPSDARAMEPQLEVSDYAALVHDPDAGYADPTLIMRHSSTIPTRDMPIRSQRPTASRRQRPWKGRRCSTIARSRRSRRDRGGSWDSRSAARGS